MDAGNWWGLQGSQTTLNCKKASLWRQQNLPLGVLNFKAPFLINKELEAPDNQGSISRACAFWLGALGFGYLTSDTVWDSMHKKTDGKHFICIPCTIYDHSSQDQRSFKLGNKWQCYFTDSLMQMDQNESWKNRNAMPFSQTEPVWMSFVLYMRRELLCRFPTSQRKWTNAELGLLQPSLTFFWRE